jgi:5-methylcytosine-specific restriction endonuclease McrA
MNVKEEEMQKHVKNYLQYFDLGEQSIWQCEACAKQYPINNGLQIHHIIFRSHGGSDDIKNCICLCVKCRERAHGSLHPVSKGEFTFIHNNFLNGNRKTFLR